MTVARQFLAMASFDLLRFRRNPATAFFTVVLPIIFLVLFTSLFGNETLESGARVATFYVPGILGLSIVSATMVNLATTTTIRRERGMIKRLRGTPLPPWVFIASQAATAAFVALLMTAVITIVGNLAFDVSFRWATLPTLAVTLAIGSASFCALGLALTTVIPTEDAAPAITNAVVLPLYFVSDVFVVTENVPRFAQLIGDIFPIRHLVSALQSSFDPFQDGAALPVVNWLVIAAWGLIALAVNAKKFRWTAK